MWEDLQVKMDKIPKIMGKTVRILPDNTISIIEIPWTLDGWYAAIQNDCQIVEPVTVVADLPMYKLPSHLIMLVDEEGAWHKGELNLCASLLAGCHLHGGIIVGTAIFAVASGEELLPLDFPELFLEVLTDKYPFLEKEENN
jgi:hypothetical protein